jgi:hypothetical protein
MDAGWEMDPCASPGHSCPTARSGSWPDDAGDLSSIVFNRAMWKCASRQAAPRRVQPRSPAPTSSSARLACPWARRWSHGLLLDVQLGRRLDPAVSRPTVDGPRDRPGSRRCRRDRRTRPGEAGDAARHAHRPGRAPRRSSSTTAATTPSSPCPPRRHSAGSATPAVTRSSAGARPRAHGWSPPTAAPSPCPRGGDRRSRHAHRRAHRRGATDPAALARLDDRPASATSSSAAGSRTEDAQGRLRRRSPGPVTGGSPAPSSRPPSPWPSGPGRGPDQHRGHLDALPPLRAAPGRRAGDPLAAGRDPQEPGAAGGGHGPRRRRAAPHRRRPGPGPLGARPSGRPSTSGS